MSTFAINLLNGDPILLNKDIIDLSGATIQYADYLPLSGGTLTGNVEFTYTSNQLFTDIDNNIVGGIGITPQFSENLATDEMVFIADDFAENGLNPLGVRIKGAYTTLSSNKLNIGVQGAQFGSRLVATSINSSGEVEVGWETPQTPDYNISIDNDIDLLIGSGVAPTTWIALTSPLVIERNVASTKGTFYLDLLVENSTSKSGVFELSWGKNGGSPTIGIATYQIPANYKSIITWTYTNDTLLSGDTITPYGRVFTSNNNQFRIDAINSERPTTLKFNVNLNGNTNLSQSGTTTTLTILSDTGSDIILSGATSGSSGLLVATDKTKLDTLIQFSGTNLSQSGTTTTLTILSDSGNDVILSGATSGTSGLLIGVDKTKLDTLVQFSGTNLSQSSTTTTLSIISDTGGDVILSGATSGSSGLMVAIDKTNLDNLIGLSGSTYIKNVSNISGVTLTETLNNINNKISNINNTSDLNKPISNASRSILDGLNGNGVVSGITLSINVDNTKFNINPGVYHQILDGDIAYSGSSGITPSFLLTNNATYIALNLTGGTVQQTTNFTKKQRRTNIILGTIIHSNKTNINVVNNTPDVAVSLLSQFNDYLDVMGIMNDGDGNIFSANGVNLFLNKSNGYILKRGVNFIVDVDSPLSINTPALIAPSNIRHRLSNGVEYPDTNSIEKYYESSPGVRTPISNGDFGIFRINLFPSNLIRIQYPQNVYGTMAQAKQALSIYDPFVIEDNIRENGLLRGFLIVKGNATDLTNNTQAFFAPADRFGSSASGSGGGGTTTLQQAYDNSITPEITTNSILGALSIKNGVDDYTPCFEIFNSGGTKTLSIDSNSNIVFGKASGIGLRFDTTTPVYGWRDLVGQIIPRASGGPAPALGALRGTNLLSYAFSVNDVIDNITYHIPHDYVPGSDMYMHVHWSHNGTAISGTLGINYFVSYCKGYNQTGQTFNSELTIPQSIATTNIATYPRWSHNINEFLLTNSSGDTTHLNRNLIEVDGLLLVSLAVTSIPTITGGLPNAPYILMVDIHYQSTGLPTKGRNIPFYV